MTRALIIGITIVVVTLLIISAFRKDEDLPEPTFTTVTEEISHSYEEEIEILASIPEKQPDTRKGIYEFEIDKSKFRLELEYNLPENIFKIRNISDLVSHMTTSTSEVPYRVYHNNRVTLEKLWGSNLSHYYGLGYEKHIFGGLSIGIASGFYIGPVEYAGLIGIKVSYGF